MRQIDISRFECQLHSKRDERILNKRWIDFKIFQEHFPRPGRKLQNIPKSMKIINEIHIFKPFKCQLK